MRADAADFIHTVVAIEVERGPALAAVGRVDGLVLNGLVLEVLIILPVFVSDGANLFRRLPGEFAVGSLVGEFDFLAGRDADFALQQDQVFVECVLSHQKRLLLHLKLNRARNSSRFAAVPARWAWCS